MGKVFSVEKKFQIAKLKCDKMKQKIFPEKMIRKGMKKKKADFLLLHLFVSSLTGFLAKPFPQTTCTYFTVEQSIADYLPLKKVEFSLVFEIVQLWILERG